MSEEYFGLTIGRWTVIGTIGGLIVLVLEIIKGKSRKKQIIKGNKVDNVGNLSGNNILYNKNNLLS